jgi:hypothetical protein
MQKSVPLWQCLGVLSRTVARLITAPLNRVPRLATALIV